MSDRRSDFTFARRPVWLLGHLVAVVAIVMFFMFGSWQLSRLEERRAENATIEQRSFGAPMGLDEALAVWDEDPSDLDYQRIAVGGTYRYADEFFVGPSSLDGASGFRVVTPLDVNGEIVLVARGWVSLGSAGPPVDSGATAGPGVVDGYVLRDEARFRGVPKIGTDLDIGRAGRIDITLLAPNATPVPFYIVQQLPEDGVRTLGDPSFDEGKHLAYAFQWYAFSAVTAIGYVVLMVRTGKQGSKRANSPPTRHTDA
jgi:cytochrome oxidase assembly protein ShyY1